MYMNKCQTYNFERLMHLIHSMFRKKGLFLFYMCECFASIYISAWCPQRPETGIGCLGNGLLKAGYTMWVWELNSGPPRCSKCF